MTAWTSFLVDAIADQLKRRQHWRDRLQLNSSPECAIHLAVFIEPFLQFVLEGKKTVESRFSVNQCAPYKAVQSGDLILIKGSGGPIVGVAEVSKTWFYELDKQALHSIRTRFGSLLCVEDSSFWDSKRNSCYATLIQLGQVESITPITCLKRDRRGWVVVREPQRQSRLEAVAT
jgi:ASC-1-like (ASCH) protein